MDAQLHKNITVLTTFVVIVFAGLLLLYTPRLTPGLGGLVGGYVALVLARDFILRVDLRRISGVLFLSAQLVWGIAVAVVSEHFFAQVFVLILIGEFSFHQSKTLSLLFTAVSYAGIVLSIWIHRHFPPFEEIYYVFPRAVEYFAIFAVSLLARLAFQQKNQLAADNERLQAASLELRRKAQLQERTRISRDMHDSVGHTLTSALTGLQTAARAIEKNRYPLALEMIERTRQSILAGLDDVRTSVHLLRENVPGPQLVPELLELIDETRQQTGVDIEHAIDPSLPELPPLIEIALYRALQEGLTNGIRHGSATRFRFALTRDGGSIRFVLADNGKPPAHIAHGFGLTAMKERVEDAGGTMRIAKQEADRGVLLEITIPMFQGEIRSE